MEYKPIFNYKSKIMIVDLHKPIYGSFFGIWDKWLKLARISKMQIVVNTPFGKATYKNYKEYISGAKKMKRYYKNPDEPMIFWGRDFLPDIKEREKRKKEETMEDNTKMSLAKAYQMYKRHQTGRPASLG
jgi:hypothetical protein